MVALQKAVEHAGTVSALAALLGVAPSAPSMWKARGSVPAEHAPLIERATEGQVTVDELCPNVHWARIPDASWPHPAGRPTIDVAAPQPRRAAMSSDQAASAPTDAERPPTEGGASLVVASLLYTSAGTPLSGIETLRWRAGDLMAALRSVRAAVLAAAPDKPDEW